jgi:hypothetical protein
MKYPDITPNVLKVITCPQYRFLSAQMELLSKVLYAFMKKPASVTVIRIWNYNLSVALFLFPETLSLYVSCLTTKSLSLSSHSSA